MEPKVESPHDSADILSVLDAPSSGGTAELDVEHLQSLAASGMSDRGTAELDVDDLEEVDVLHDRGTDLIEVSGDASPDPAKSR